MDAGSLAAGPRRSGCTLALPYRPARRGIALLGGRIAHSSQPHAAVTSAAVDLVILSDSLVADPRMVRDLHSRGVPHLPVRVRDGIGLVGPPVIPGATSCPGNYLPGTPGRKARV
jgi:hypothetical protein